MSVAYGNDPVNWLADTPSPGASKGPAVLAPPAVIEQPQSAVVAPGTTATLSVAATNASLRRYRARLVP